MALGMNKTATDRACLGEGCIDDLCRNTRVCLAHGWALGERCGSCGAVYNHEFSEDCDCDPPCFADDRYESDEEVI